MYENEIYSGPESIRQSSVQTPNAESQPTGSGASYATYYASAPVYTGDIGNDGKAKRCKEPKKKSGVLRKFILSISLGLCFGLFAGLGFYAVQLGTGQLTKEEQSSDTSEATSAGVVNDQASPQPGLTNVSHITYVQTDISDMVETVMPSMVSILNYMETTTYWGHSVTEPSGGSGIIVAENEDALLIVTNNHVVEDAQKLMVTFIDGSEAEAVVKGLDAEMDLAVIAVPISDLTDKTLEAIEVATLGDSDSLKLGEPVIAIGNALGYGQSVTNGIVSALNREITMSDGSSGVFIQTNAAINPGNSGGALLNLSGEVIGINSSKIGGSLVEGMGYAIPITSANPIISDLMTREVRTAKVPDSQRGYMGITLQNITDQISQMYGMPKGAFVYDVEPGLAADDAGVMKGDIIVGFDGQKINSSDALLSVMEFYKAGETVTITVRRVENGEYVSYDLEITLGKKP